MSIVLRSSLPDAIPSLSLSHSRFRVSNPESIDYNVTEGITSAKSNEADIGPQVMHVYQVKNHGPSTVDQAHVTILWPSLTTDNQHLLYLLDQPSVTGKISCQTITLDEVNPLRLPVSLL